MFEKAKDFIKRIQKININKVIKTVLSDNSIQEEILNMNKYDQLYYSGIDSTGKSLGDYRPYTLNYKKNIAGSFGYDTRTANLTLKDTGYFYSSFKIKLYNNSFGIIADDQKQNGDNLTYTYGINILGLTNENKNNLARLIKYDFLQECRNQIDKK